MHNGIVHDDGRSPGWIFLVPHDGESGKGAWVRFDNDEKENDKPKKWLPVSTIIEFDDKNMDPDPTKVYKKKEFFKWKKKDEVGWEKEWEHLGIDGQTLYNKVRKSEGKPEWPIGHSESSKQTV